MVGLLCPLPSSLPPSLPPSFLPHSPPPPFPPHLHTPLSLPPSSLPPSPAHTSLPPSLPPPSPLTCPPTSPSLPPSPLPPHLPPPLSLPPSLLPPPPLLLSHQAIQQYYDAYRSRKGALQPTPDDIKRFMDMPATTEFGDDSLYTGAQAAGAGGRLPGSAPSRVLMQQMYDAGRSGGGVSGSTTAAAFLLGCRLQLGRAGGEVTHAVWATGLDQEYGYS